MKPAQPPHAARPLILTSFLAMFLAIHGRSPQAQNPVAIVQEPTPAATETEPKPEPLRIDRFPGYYYGSNPLTSDPEVILRFSAPVTEDAARAHFTFRDKDNTRRIPVEVFRPSAEEVKKFQPYSGQDERNLLSIDHFMKIHPLTPLPVGANWQIEMRGGLASNDGKQQLAKTRIDRLGTLYAFEVRSVRPINQFDRPMEIAINLNKKLNDSITEEVLAGFVNVVPKPAGFAAEKDNYMIRLKGKFERDKNYRVSVMSGLVGHDLTRLDKSSNHNVKFTANDGFVSLPAFSTTQAATGVRRFDISTGNLQNLRVRVKQLNDRDLVYALRGYDALYEGYGEQQRIPFEMVPGKTIYDHKHPRTVEIDHSEKITLTWPDLLQGKKHAGLYICAEGPSATKGKSGAGGQAIIQLTDIGMAWKQGRDETLVFAFSLESGEPLTGLSIEALDSEAEPLAEIITDEHGIARVPKNRTGDARWLAARNGKDRHIIEYRENMSAISLWRFSIPYRYAGEGDDFERRTLLFTDRPVYKPGERVFLKCLTRMTDNDRLLLPGNDRARAQVKLYDSRGRLIAEREATVNEHGSFEDNFELPAEKTLGWYRVEVDFNDPENPGENPWNLKFQHGFQVAEYRANTFEIAIDTKESYEAEKSFQLPVSAKYFMGKPLSKAQMQWHVSASSTWPQVRGFENFAFGDTTADQSHFSTSQTVHLREDGSSRIDFELPDQGETPAPLRVNVNSEITDINQQTVAESASFIVNSSDFYLGIQRPEGIHRAGAEVQLAIAAVSPDSKIHEAPVEATMKIEKKTFNTVKVKGAGGRLVNRTDEKIVTVEEKPVTVETRAHEETGTPLPSVAPFKFAEAGEYLVSVTAKDENGRAVVSKTRVRIFGADEPAWSYHNDVRIEVTADRENYEIGDTAKLLVRSPILGKALVTTERAGVREVKSIELTGHETVVEIPIAEGDAPNLFASVLVIRGSGDSPHRHASADYRIGYCQLKIEDPAAALEVAIEPREKEYELPGSPVEIAATVRNHEGNPVPNTEVTLYAVDEGVLSLTGYETPEPGNVFNAPFPLVVRTGQSISDLLAEDPKELSFANKGYVIGGGGAAAMDPDRVRKNFKALAFWGGSLISGPDGRVTASFTAPDNLTTYRVIAVASAGNRFGSGEGDLIINKPLVIEPALPAFGNVTDQMDLTAILHNNTEETVELEIEVNLDPHAEFLAQIPDFLRTSLPGEIIKEDPVTRVRRLTLKAGETNRLSFPAQFTRMGEAKWNWRATSLKNPDLTDAVESKLEIGYPIPLLRGLETVTVTEAKTPSNALAEIDPTLLNGRGNVRVSLSNSRVIEAMDALKYLLQYPYGCVEQTTSTTLPWLSTQSLRKSLPQLNRSDQEIAANITAGTRRLLSMQTHEGGLGYWPGTTEPTIWASAYGGMALAKARRLGNDLPEARLNAIWDYLSVQLRNTAKVTKPSELYQRALAAYTLALAGRGEPAYHEVLFNKRNQLSTDTRAIVAMAMLETAGEKRDSATDERIRTLLTEPPGGTKNDSFWYRRSYATARQLQAWSLWDPTHPRTTALLNELMDSSRIGMNGWGSTYLNSTGLMALAQHSSSAAHRLKDANCVVRFGDETRELRFGEQASGKTFDFEFEGDRSNTPLNIEIDADVNVYAHVEVETQPKIIDFAAQNHGFGITRTYHKLDAAGEVHPIEKLEVGDLVLVSLHLSIPQGERFDYLAIDDPLPAIFEAVNPEFKSRAGTQKSTRQGNWKRLYTHYKELRKDRALFFCNYLYKGGDYAVEYLARVVAPGVATAPPAKIEAMYEPERYGLSSTARITATPLQVDPKNRVAQR